MLEWVAGATGSMGSFETATQWLIEHGGAIGLLAFFAILACVALYRDGNKTRDKLDELNEKRVADLLRTTEVLNRVASAQDSNRMILESWIAEQRARPPTAGRRMP